MDTHRARIVSLLPFIPLAEENGLILPMGQWVRDMGADSSAIAQTIIAMAKNLNLHVIAEGAETEDQQQLLYYYGCMHYQGYLFSKPVPVDQFEALLTG